MGQKEALKQYALEKHTADDLTNFIKDNGLEEAVDFVTGGHIDLIFTEQELEIAKDDFQLAKEAGADLSDARWFSNEEMKKVNFRYYIYLYSFTNPPLSLAPVRITAPNMLV